jgi:hypothetical protein
VIDMETSSTPTILWRLRRDERTAHAEVIPRRSQATLLVWIDNGIDGAEDFIEWGGAIERADVVRAGLLREGWTDVS